MMPLETSTIADAAPAGLAPKPKMGLSDWLTLSATIAAPGVLSIMVVLSHYTIVPLMAEFHAPRATIMFFLALGVVGQILFAPIVGRVLTKVAPWKVMLTGVVFVSAGLYLASLAPSLILIMAAFFFTLAIGCTLSAPVASSTPLASQAIIARQFPRIMGRAVAVQGVIISIASIAMPLIVAPYVTAHGWRITVATAAVVALLYTVPMILLFLRKAGVATAAPAAADARSAIVAEGAPTTRQILSSPNFWLLLLALEPMVLVVNGIAPNIIPFFADRGISVDAAKYTLSALAASSGVGALIGGFVADRIGPWIYMTVISIGCLLGMAALTLNLWDPGIPFIIFILSISGVVRLLDRG